MTFTKNCFVLITGIMLCMLLSRVNTDTSQIPAPGLGPGRYGMLIRTGPFRNEGLLELNEAILSGTPRWPVWENSRQPDPAVHHNMPGKKPQ